MHVGGKSRGSDGVSEVMGGGDGVGNRMVESAVHALDGTPEEKRRVMQKLLHEAAATM